jgi:ATP-dependent Clp protease protease subunit
MGGFITFPPEPSDWGASIRARLFDQRVVFITGDLTDEAAGGVAMELMTLDATGDDAVQLHLESDRGQLGAALALMDVIDTMGVPVVGVAMGLLGGPAVGVLTVCSRRVAMPHARFHLREPDAAFGGDARSIERWLENRRLQWSEFCDRMAVATRRSASEIASLWNDARYLSAQDALAAGLVHEIARRVGAVSELRRPGFGNDR